MNVNEQLHAHAALPGAFDDRFHEPTSSYRSRSHSHSLTPDEVCSDPTENTPELLQKLADNAKAFPLLWEQNKYSGWTAEQIQRDVDAWKEVAREVEEEAEKKE